MLYLLPLQQLEPPGLVSDTALRGVLCCKARRRKAHGEAGVDLMSAHERKVLRTVGRGRRWQVAARVVGIVSRVLAKLGTEVFSLLAANTLTNRNM